MTEGFVNPMKWFAVKLNTLLKISLTERINWQKTWPTLILWKSNERSLIGVLPKCEPGDFFFLLFFVTHQANVLNGCLSECVPDCPQVTWLCLNGLLIYFFLSLSPHLHYSSSKDRDGKATKDEKGERLIHFRLVSWFLTNATKDAYGFTFR